MDLTTFKVTEWERGAGWWWRLGSFSCDIPTVKQDTVGSSTSQHSINFLGCVGHWSVSLPWRTEWLNPHQKLRLYTVCQSLAFLSNVQLNQQHHKFIFTVQTEASNQKVKDTVLMQSSNHLLSNMSKQNIEYYAYTRWGLSNEMFISMMY